MTSMAKALILSSYFYKHGILELDEKNCVKDLALGQCDGRSAALLIPLIFSFLLFFVFCFFAFSLSLFASFSLGAFHTRAMDGAFAAVEDRFVAAAVEVLEETRDFLDCA